MKREVLNISFSTNFCAVLLCVNLSVDELTLENHQSHQWHSFHAIFTFIFQVCHHLHSAHSYLIHTAGITKCTRQKDTTEHIAMHVNDEEEGRKKSENDTRFLLWKHFHLSAGFIKRSSLHVIKSSLNPLSHHVMSF